MNTTLFDKSIRVFVFASALASNVHSQSDDSPPLFRPRTDPNSARDVQLLRDELNKAIDSKGAVNPLGNFLQRNAQPAESAPLKFGLNGPSVSDKESAPKPNIDPTSTTRNTATASSHSNATKRIEMLPGPRYTIIQQVRPQPSNSVANSVADGFRPARFVSDIEANVQPSLQDPVAFASADIPIVGQPRGYIANFQDIPFGATGRPAPFVPPSNNILPNNPQSFPTGNLQNNPGAIAAPIIPYNPQPVLPDATNPPILPYASGGAPQTNFGATAPIYSTPIPNNVPLGTTTSPPLSSPPLSSPIPYYNPSTIGNQPQFYNPSIPIGVNPGLSGSVPMRSPSESVMPNYPRSSSIVNSAPFVSSPPYQFDARNMVSRSLYRQSVDPCTQPARGAPNAYAPLPYATQPGGSPFSYVPPTAMAVSNNGYNSGYRSLLGFGQSLNNAYLGRGIIGQPTAYVDGQPFRNFFRYIFP